MIARRSVLAMLAVTLCAFSSISFAQYAERKIRISAGVPEENPASVGVRKMQEILNAKSGGKIKLTGYYNGVLGNDNQAVAALRSGTQEMVITSSSPLAGLIKELGIFDLPFLFANEKEAYAVLDGPAGDYFNKRLEEIGLVNLAYWENGFRNLTNSKRSVAKLEDLSGLKVRVMQNNIFIDAFREWGANPVPMPKSELYTALEMKAVDGQENPFIDIETNKMFEVQKYMTASRHAYTPWLVLYSKKLWDELSADERSALREAAVEARKVQREANRTLDEKALVNLKAKGMVVSELSTQERARIVEKVKPVYERNLATYSKEGPELVFATLKKIQ
ncbi:TRAP transporter substrate-binding protein [Propionivibrio dicarboxylicus]|uniref:Tripartite ATP-independent transporter solute receptor, DctP family n=1 Tax=Propionivibrio dicarboxylicus TaxID=83767 RepID=A0A1G8J2R1_9RHOO|nr:TRAP transporter substrate-binding protein [Propionivibrio dicarboxylicus]SDI24950.1 tripartite ATP-independent transporter solute receptor, DctP family [Propionivibrio dicarboxylicus]